MSFLCKGAQSFYSVAQENRSRLKSPPRQRKADGLPKLCLARQKRFRNGCWTCIRSLLVAAYTILAFATRRFRSFRQSYRMPRFSRGRNKAAVSVCCGFVIQTKAFSEETTHQLRNSISASYNPDLNVEQLNTRISLVKTMPAKQRSMAQAYFFTWSWLTRALKPIEKKKRKRSEA